MKRPSVRLAIALAALLALALPALAAELHEPHQGTACKAGEVGTWHFVANQTEGATEGWLVVDFDSGNLVGPLEPDKINRNVMHWWIRDAGTELVNARTYGDLNSASQYPAGGEGLAGKLVLSEWACKKLPPTGK